jgi:hypothetical protein
MNGILKIFFIMLTMNCISCEVVTTNFGFTGTAQSFVVPAGVTSLVGTTCGAEGTTASSVSPVSNSLLRNG